MADVQVGTCKPHLHSFSTISAAVSGVPPFTTIQVCPGTYPEQVLITQPLTLQGVTVGTANQALITVPPAGLLPNTISMFGESVAAQVLVEGAGQVNITNIAVDGTGGDMSCLSWIAGIFYGSGSTGIVNRVRASGQVDGTCGVGIWAENSNSTNEWVTIRNSSVYNVDSAGIFVGSGPTPTLTVDVNNDVVSASAATAAIDSDSVNGMVSNNNITSSVFGVYDIASAVTVGANTVMGATYGIFLGSGGTAAGNQISGSSQGILLGASGATLSNNRIVSSTTAGVELGCFPTASVSGNFINDAPVGFDSAPGSFSAANNNLSNTATTITNGCAFAALARKAVPARTNLQQQWHTPATPFGTRTK